MIKNVLLAALAVVGLGAGVEAATYRGTFSITEAYIDYNVMDDELREREYLPAYWGLDLGKAYTAKFEFSRPVTGTQQSLKLSVGSIVLYDDVIEGEGTGYSGFMSDDNVEMTSIRSFDGLIGRLFYTLDQTDLVAVDGDYVMQPAPIPLPASSALLPLGIGALAMMRKRRKRVC